MEKLAQNFFRLRFVAWLLLVASPLPAQEDAPYKGHPPGHEQNKQRAASAYEHHLKKHAGDYVAMARNTAAASRSLTEAMRGEDATRIETARKSLENAVDPEERILRAVNAFCQTP